MKRTLLLVATLAIAAPALDDAAAESNSRNVPVKLSRQLVDPWVMQLRPSTRFGPSRQRLISPRYRAETRQPTTRSRAVQSPRTWPQERVASVSRVHPTAPPAKKKTAGRQIDPQFLPTVVDYDGSESKGTIVIETGSRYLYLVEGSGRARRYGVGVGRPGFEWAGTHTISRKAEWPDWRPPAEMRERQPSLPEFMAGGPRNPLGARAMYLGSSLYRIHGSNEPWTIGRAVSSGCIRMRN
ncbi:MAG: L,D-transpeptidase, partial [Hyphomicrobiales bacterium]|nr:L,D-transpeptidase [Hyphomicrobiales bacterium]